MPKISNSSNTDLENRVRELELEKEQLLNEVQLLNDVKHFVKLFSLYKKGAAENLMSTESPLRLQDHDRLSTLDNMSIMIGYWDKNLLNRFGNQAYSSWFGITPAQMLGMHIQKVIGEKSFIVSLPYIEGVLRGENQKFECAIPLLGGNQIRHLLVEYIPDIINGEVMGFFAQVTLR